MTRKKSKMGRPPRHGGERLSKSRTFRVRPQLDGLLQVAAAKAGRSVSEEIEQRLDQSFQKAHEADLITNALRAVMGEPTGDLVRAITIAIWLIERNAGKKWTEDLEAAWEVSGAVDDIVNAIAGLPRGAERAAKYFAYYGVAFETLQKMGIMPSDAEMTERASRRLAEIRAFEASVRAEAEQK